MSGTGFAAVDGCFLCPGNDLLAFEPRTVDGAGGYVIPGSMPVKVDDEVVLVPLPYSALIVADDHPPYDHLGLGLTLPDTWIGTVKLLLPLVTDYTPGDPWNLSTQHRHEAGARVPRALTDAGHPAHPFMWFVHARHALTETPTTATLGLATIIKNSRQAAESLPSDQDLARVWRQACGYATDADIDPIGVFHYILAGAIR